ncbi:MAG: beta-lactamase family protein, partial [Myxococcales bacterium]|nr:beta-lactamase family protein [Myxococcales bacterium]
TADGRAWTRTRRGPTSTRFWWASVGKAFTAMVILGLVDEGRLDLDQALADFAPTIANADGITIRHLLAHTSGIYSFQADPDLRQRSGHIPPSELIAVASAHGPDFCPGSRWSYSNTGYVLLGQIIEAVEGAPYHDVVNRRLLAPLVPEAADPSAAIEALAPGASPRDLVPLAPGSAAASAPHHDLTTPFAAGVIAASSLDMARAWRRFLGGEVVSPAALAAMFAEVHPLFDSPVESYGLGVMVYRLAAADPRERDVWLGHSGGTVGGKALVAYSSARRAVVAVALTGEGAPEAIALHLLRVLDRATRERR